MTHNDIQQSPRFRRPLRLRANQVMLVCVGLAIGFFGWGYQRLQGLRALLAFDVRVDGQSVTNPSAYAATVGERPVKSGEAAGLGWREFRVAMADAAPFCTNVFIWYGLNDLGRVELAHHRGEMRLTIEPVAKAVWLAGPYHRISLTNTPGMTSSVPVGKYEGRVVFDHFEERIELAVASNQVCARAMRPAVSRLRLASEPAGAKFQLTGIDRTHVDLKGEVPSTVGPLAPGNYHVRMWRGDYLKETNLALSPGMTHRFAMVFEYGEIALTSQPTGALVYAKGSLAGRTPMKVRDLRPGYYEFTLKRPGYQAAKLGTEVRGGGVIKLTTNLLSVRFAQALERARAAVAADPPEYSLALSRVEEALEERPGDTQALALKAECEAVLKAEQARAAEKQKAEDIEARQRHPDELFHRLTDRRRFADLFDTQSLHLEGTVDRTRAAVLRALAADPPWEILLETKPDADTRLIEARFLSLTSGKRTIVVVAGQVTDEGVDVFYKIWDYALGPRLGTGRTGTLSEENLVPLHPDDLSEEKETSIATRRKKVVEEFKIRLLRELSTVRSSGVPEQ